MLVPLTIGKLIDFFASPTHETFFGLSFPVAAAALALTFCIGAAANAGRAILMRLSGQRIIARVRWVLAFRSVVIGWNVDDL